MKRSSAGEIVLSSAETAYQLGLDRHAAFAVFSENRVSEIRSLHRAENVRPGRVYITSEVPEEGFLR